MLHLSTERLSALVDEPPNAIEAAHLAACPGCARERDAHQHLAALARMERGRPFPPLSNWEGIAAALGHESETAPAHAATTPRRALPPAWRRVAGQLAAAATLLVVGVAGGRLSAGAAPIGVGGPVVTVTVTDTLATAPTAVEDDVHAMGLDAGAFHTTDDALVALARAERQYQAAATFLAAHDSSAEPLADSSEVFRARLAALDAVMAGTRTALYEAPHDPVINRYYLATLGAREATVRQLGSSLPDGQSVSRF
jgi:hypothetical protein